MPNPLAVGEGLARVLTALRVGSPPMLERVVTTMLFGRDHAYLDQPWVSARTIEIESSGLSVVDFDIPKSEIEAFYAKGYATAQDFLSSWDWDAYRERFR